jgi:hypothetical protein
MKLLYSIVIGVLAFLVSNYFFGNFSLAKTRGVMEFLIESAFSGIAVGLAVYYTNTRIAKSKSR